MTLRFQCDEHIPNAVAEQLLLRGIDAATATMSGLRNTPDPVILEHSRLHQRVVVTFDSDYVDLHYSGVPYAGIAYFAGRQSDIGCMVEMLELLDGVYDPNQFENRLEYL